MPELETQLDTSVAASLKQNLIDRILREGPITFHEWMASALYDPSLGYYTRADLKRWGREGDYRTSPERSELFAATLAKYFSLLYEKLDQPDPFTILEFGAGDGTFAHGVLSYLRDQSPEVFRAAHYLVDEVSDDSRNRSSQKLSEFDERVKFVSLADLTPLHHAIVFSNEFLDAFPVHRLQMIDGKLSELYVSVDRDGEFVWSARELSMPWLAEFVELSNIRLVENQIIEVSRNIEDWFGGLARIINRGFVVTIDYGRDASDLYDFNARPEGTLRSYSRHHFEKVLESPGEIDITTTVDWSYVKRCGVANGFSVTELNRLDQFLLKAGILDELGKRLESICSDAEKLQLTTAAREMVLPDGMASSFQVLVQNRG
jgi:SAM-dependent MidA family methyltransferase